jgi:myosin-crossreactive antigen
MNTVLKDLYDELVELNKFTPTIHITDILRSIGHLYLEKERQQIIDAHVECVRHGTEMEAVTKFTANDEKIVRKDIEDYYDQKFGKTPPTTSINV